MSLNTQNNDNDNSNNNNNNNKKKKKNNNNNSNNNNNNNEMTQFRKTTARFSFVEEMFYVLCSVELMMDVEHPKHVFHKAKKCCCLSKLCNNNNNKNLARQRGLFQDVHYQNPLLKE